MTCTFGYYIALYAGTRSARCGEDVLGCDEGGKRTKWDTAALSTCSSNTLTAGDHVQRGPYIPYSDTDLPSRFQDKGHSNSGLEELMTKAPDRVTSEVATL